MRSFIQKIAWAISRGLMAAGLSTTIAQVVAYGLMTLIALLAVFFVFVQVRSCFAPKVKIDEESIQKINQANETQRREELKKVIEENQGVIETVDNRTLETETNIAEREKVIEEKVKEADKRVEEAKRQGKDVTAAELECLLVGNCQ